MKYYKVLNSLMQRCGYQYTPGVNDLHGMVDDGHEPMVSYFTDVTNILRYIDCGPILCEVNPKWGKVYDPETFVKDGEEIPGWYTDRIWLSKPMRLWTVETFDKLIKEGAKFIFKDDNYHLFKKACLFNVEVFYYLIDVAKLQPELYEDICKTLQVYGFM